MIDRKPLSDVEVSGLVSQGIRHAEDHDRTELSKRRTKALEYISGVMKDTPAEKGRSSVVSRDVADTIGWILPGIMRVFTASDHFAKVDAVTQADEPFAGQATDGINYVFIKKNHGYKVIYDATWDALAAGNGIVKVFWDETPEYETSFHSGLSDDQLRLLISEDDVEVLAYSGKEMPADPMATTAMTPVAPTMLHDIKIRRLKSDGKIVVESIAPEDYGIDGNATSTDDAKFQYHRAEKTRSELIAMGFDRVKVDELQVTVENDTGRQWEDHDPNALDASVERVDLYECYFHADVDGDGSSEVVRAYWAGNKGGGTLLDWETWEDDAPFYDIPCGPVPHRWEAESIADETMDVQRVKTVLLRQALDNIYAQNIPQRWARTGSVDNPDELYSPNFGGVIWGNSKSEGPPVPIVVPFVADKAFAAIDYQDQVIQRRTGVNRQTAALDPEALVNQSATANQNERDASYSQIEQIARNMAELGWSRVFRAILKLMVKHQDRKETIRLRDKWVEIDPRFWNTDMDVTINVGLGTGSRDRDLSMLGAIFGQQQAFTAMLGQAGMQEEALGMVPRISTTLSKFAESAGIKTPEMFFPEIGEDKIGMALQRMQQAKSQPPPELQMKMQESQAQLQQKAQEHQADFQLKQAQMQAEGRMSIERLQNEMDLKRYQIDAEMQLKRDQLAAELQLKRELAMLQVQTAAMTPATSSVHVGGEPG